MAGGDAAHSVTVVAFVLCSLCHSRSEKGRGHTEPNPPGAKAGPGARAALTCSLVRPSRSRMWVVTMRSISSRSRGYCWSWEGREGREPRARGPWERPRGPPESRAQGKEREERREEGPGSQEADGTKPWPPLTPVCVQTAIKGLPVPGPVEAYWGNFWWEGAFRWRGAPRGQPAPWIAAVLETEGGMGPLGTVSSQGVHWPLGGRPLPS